MEIIVKIEKTMTMTNTWTKTKTVKFLYDSGSSSLGRFILVDLGPGEGGGRPNGLKYFRPLEFLTPKK